LGLGVIDKRYIRAEYRKYLVDVVAVIRLVAHVVELGVDYSTDTD
jgi:hypothetical protein